VAASVVEKTKKAEILCTLGELFFINKTQPSQTTRGIKKKKKQKFDRHIKVKVVCCGIESARRRDCGYYEE
jgi:hypothetical protein